MREYQTAALDSPRAWAVCFAAFVAAFVVFGVSYSFGVFLKPMELAFGTGHAVMSTLFSTLTALSFFLSPLTGDLADRHGPARWRRRARFCWRPGLSLRLTFIPFRCCISPTEWA